MAVDPELLAMLACPACESHPPVILCALKEPIAKSLVEKYRDKFRDEEPIVTEGLGCRECHRVYPIVSDIPVMLIEEALTEDAQA
jgi:uncharacterized protein YbaR (Trm112 family)